MHKYIVSRQLSWPDGHNYVEIETEGPDHVSPGQFGESSAFDDPREAVEYAIELRDSWRRKKPSDDVLGVGVGAFSADISPPVPEGDNPNEDEELRSWADRVFGSLPKCDRCGELITEGKAFHLIDDPDMGNFCSEFCCEKTASDNTMVVIENNQEEFWDAEGGVWVDDPALATNYFFLEVRNKDEMPVKGYVVDLDEAIAQHKDRSS